MPLELGIHSSTLSKKIIINKYEFEGEGARTRRVSVPLLAAPKSQSSSGLPHACLCPGHVDIERSSVHVLRPDIQRNYSRLGSLART